MIAARLAGGNLFFGLLGWGFLGWGILWWGFLVGIFGALGAARSTRIFFGGFLEHSEQLGALGFFLRGFFCGDFLF